MSIYLDILLLILFLLASLWSVMSIRLLRGVIGLALTSVILSVIMFRLASPIAAVFELSVCAGLISVIFITTTSFTRRVSKERFVERERERLSKFWPLPLILIICGLILFRVDLPGTIIAPILLPEQKDLQHLLWDSRQIELVGQIIVLLVGAFGVAVMFKEEKK